MNLLGGQRRRAGVQYLDALDHLRKAERLTNRARDPLEWAPVPFAIGWILYSGGRDT